MEKIRDLREREADVIRRALEAGTGSISSAGLAKLRAAFEEELYRPGTSGERRLDLKEKIAPIEKAARNLTD